MEVVYHKAIKALLGVSITTPNDLCLVELGYAPFQAYVKNKQSKFFNSMVAKRADMEDGPLMFAY